MEEYSTSDLVLLLVLSPFIFVLAIAALAVAGVWIAALTLLHVIYWASERLTRLLTPKE